MICLIATTIALPQHIDEVRAALQALVEPTRQEPGCIQYLLHQPVGRPEVFVFYEQFVDQAAFDYHAQQPYIEAFRTQSQGWLQVPSTIEFLQKI